MLSVDFDFRHFRNLLAISNVKNIFCALVKCERIICREINVLIVPCVLEFRQLTFGALIKPEIFCVGCCVELRCDLIFSPTDVSEISQTLATTLLSFPVCVNQPLLQKFYSFYTMYKVNVFQPF